MRLLRWFQQKAAPVVANTPHDIELLLRASITATSNGINVTPSAALRVPEVLACISVIAQGVAMLPLTINQKTDEGRKRLTEHPVYRLMAQRPNRFQSPFEFKRTMLFNCAWNGNSYAYINRLRGKPLELIPLEPGTVEPALQADYSIQYKYTPNRAKKHEVTVYDQADILHLRGHVNYRGWVSESYMDVARDAIATMIAIQIFSGKYYRGGAKANGAFVLPNEGALSDEAFERLKASLNEAANGDSAPLFEQGLTWLKMDYSARESLLAEMQTLQISKLCRVWRIQPHMIQELQHATFSNIEHQSREFVDHTLMPWIIMLEQALLGQMMDPLDDSIYPKISAQALLRGDNETRAKVYQTAVGGPYMLPNQARALEDMDDIEGGEVLLRPLNMGPANANSTTTEAVTDDSA